MEEECTLVTWYKKPLIRNDREVNRMSSAFLGVEEAKAKALAALDEDSNISLCTIHHISGTLTIERNIT